MTGRDASLVAVIAVVTGVAVAAAGASPTGTPVIDTALVFLAAATTVWAAASAPWWAGVMMAAVAAALAPEWWLTAIALAALGTSLAVGLAKRSLPWTRALAAGTALFVLARLGDTGFFGLTSIVAIGVSAVVAILGIRRRSRREQLIVRRVATGISIAGGVALLGFVLGVATARPDLEEGNHQAREGIALLGQGEIEKARAAFANAQVAFERADAELGRPWVQPTRLLPVLAQHRTSAVELTGGAARATRTITSALATVDLEKLKVVDGRIDVDAIAALQTPLAELNAALDDLDAAVARARSPWLVRPLQRRLDSLTADLADQQVKGANALLAVRQAPALLGQTEPRRYFVAFTTPAEARGLGGFMGDWAELTISGGRMEMTAFGRHSILNTSGDPAAKRLTGPPEFLGRFARFGFQEPPDGRVAPDAWSDLTLDPHFPHVGEVIAQLYPASGGKALDGVFALDVYALAKVLALTGPIGIAGLDEPLTADNAARFLLYDQYTSADVTTGRYDRLEDVARTAVERLFTASLPGPQELARLLGPMAAEGRLVAWARREDEQALFRAVHMDGALPALSGGDGLSFSLNNAVGNKIDAYLEGSVLYTVTPNQKTGTVASEAVLTITNTAPATGLPDYVIGNLVDLPPGTNLTYLSIYSALPYSGVVLDGQPAALEVGTEAGYVVSSMYLELAPGQTRTLTITFDGSLDLTDGYRLTLRNPPVVGAFTIDVHVLGDEPVEHHSTTAGIVRLSIDL